MRTMMKILFVHTPVALLLVSSHTNPHSRAKCQIRRSRSPSPPCHVCPPLHCEYRVSQPLSLRSISNSGHTRPRFRVRVDSAFSGVAAGRKRGNNSHVLKGRQTLATAAVSKEAESPKYLVGGVGGRSRNKHLAADAN